MSTIWLVATREFTERLRSRVFLISNGAILVLIALSLGLPLLFSSDEATQIGVVGPEAEAVGEIAVAQQEAFGTEIELVPLDDRATAEEQLRDGALSVALLDASSALADGAIGAQLEALLANASNALRVDAALTEAGLGTEERAQLFAIEPLSVDQLGDDAAGVDLSDPSVAVVFAAVFVLYGLLAIYGQWVAQGIVEEKQSRVVEVLLSSLRPTDLLTGKILGLGALGLAQILLMAVIATAGLLLTDVLEISAAAWTGLGLVIAWYVLGFLLYATLFAMAGSVVSRVEDMQSAVMPVIIVLVLALFGAQLALGDPTSTLATVVGLFPLTAPIVQPILYAVGASTWLETLLAIALALAAMAVMIPVAARIYGGGVLRTRGRVSYRQAWSSARD